MAKNKNTMPSFTRGTLKQLQKGIADGIITAPALHFLTEEDKKCIAFYDIDGVIYQGNLERLKNVEEKLEDVKDPETGEVVSVKQYVDNALKISVY